MNHNLRIDYTESSYINIYSLNRILDWNPRENESEWHRTSKRERERVHTRVGTSARERDVCKRENDNEHTCEGERESNTRGVIPRSGRENGTQLYRNSHFGKNKPFKKIPSDFDSARWAESIGKKIFLKSLFFPKLLFLNPCEPECSARSS